MRCDGGEASGLSCTVFYGIKTYIPFGLLFFFFFSFGLDANGQL